jgi:hypothetical protein
MPSSPKYDSFPCGCTWAATSGQILVLGREFMERLPLDAATVLDGLSPSAGSLGCKRDQARFGHSSVIHISQAGAVFAQYPRAGALNVPRARCD